MFASWFYISIYFNLALTKTAEMNLWSFVNLFVVRKLDDYEYEPVLDVAQLLS